MPMGLRWGLWWHFGIRRLPKIVEVRHHDAHAAIFLVSPFEEATVLVMDGYGDETAQSAHIGSGNRLQRLWQSEFFDSLGMLYTAVTTHLGFKLFEEGTVMALAGAGSPTYAKKFRELVHLQPDGRFSINRDFISYDTHGLNKPFKERFTDAFGPRRLRNEPISDRHRDLAFALQSTIEETILHVVRALSKRHPSRNLCLTGGIALNCVANARILRDTDYRSVWVPPCASDSGAPFGSALWHYHQTLGHPRRFELTHSFYGSGYSDPEIIRALQEAGLAYRRMSEHELMTQVSRDLATGKIVGWFQGRFEIGPRALGNRSILADARDAAMKDYINARVKPRAISSVRPRCFARAGGRVLRDRPKRPIHDDGTESAGGQDASDPGRGPRRWNGAHPNCRSRVEPALLWRHRGICRTHRRPRGSQHQLQPAGADSGAPKDAIACYLRTQMDVLVLGDFYITDRPPPRSELES